MEAYANQHNIDLTKKMGAYTPEQQFFIGFAQNWCTNDRPAFIRLIVQSDPHSPDQLRANGVVRNMPEFAHAFSCKKVLRWLPSTAAASGSSAKSFPQGAAARPCPLCFCVTRSKNVCRLSAIRVRTRHSAMLHARWPAGLWGTGFFFGKIAMREMSSAHMVLYRFLFACLGLSPILLRGRPGLERADGAFYWLQLSSGCRCSFCCSLPD